MRLILCQDVGADGKREKACEKHYQGHYRIEVIFEVIWVSEKPFYAGFSLITLLTSLPFPHEVPYGVPFFKHSPS
jgi:hypothetical protein